jgi:glycosyltransferase involved in cell wall biosynthesis
MPNSILIITSEANSKVAGDSQSAVNFARALIQAGIECSIATCSNNKNAQKRLEQIPVYSIFYTGSIGTKISARLHFFFYLAIQGIRHKYWLIYGKTLGNRIAIILGFLMRRKVVFRSTLAGFDDIKTLAKRPYNKHIYSFASGYWALNNWFAKAYHETYKASKRSVFISAQGVNEKFRPVTAEQKRVLRQKLKLPYDLPIIIMVGHVTRRKGFPEIFDWLKSLKKEFHLVIVGNYSPTTGSRLSKHYDAMQNNYTYGKTNLGDSVTFTGEVYNVFEYLQAADIFLHASYLEGFPPNVLNEAMACGLPCLVRKIIGIDNKYIEQKAITLFNNKQELKAQMQDLLYSKSLREHYSKNAEKFSDEQLEIGSITQNFIQWLNSL